MAYTRKIYPQQIRHFDCTLYDGTCVSLDDLHSMEILNGYFSSTTWTEGSYFFEESTDREEAKKKSKEIKLLNSYYRRLP